MLKDIDFEFVGFGGTQGRCHLRLVRASDTAPLVVVCSQYADYYGTSITNGFELIVTKLIDDIANSRVEGVGFAGPVPTIAGGRSEHLLERLLQRMLPKRYRSSSAVSVDFVQLFASVIWIEHYPKGTGLLTDVATASVVSLGSDGSPIWRHGVSNEVIRASGLSREQLFVEGTDIDLAQCAPTWQAGTELAAPTPQQLDTALRGYRQVRWISDLLEVLPRKIRGDRFDIGIDDSTPYDEKYLHRLMAQIFVHALPAPELVGRDYPIGRTLGLYRGGRDKECDFVIFQPDQNRPYAVLEVKRTLAKRGTLQREVAHDLARLALCSHTFGSHAYQVVVGDIAQIRAELTGLLSCAFDVNAPALPIPVATMGLDREYRGALDKAGISQLYVQIQGVTDEKASSVLVWEVSHAPDRLENQRPYRFQLLSVD